MELDIKGAHPTLHPLPSLPLPCNYRAGIISSRNIWWEYLGCTNVWEGNILFSAFLLSLSAAPSHQGLRAKHWHCCQSNEFFHQLLSAICTHVSYGLSTPCSALTWVLGYLQCTKINRLGMSHVYSRFVFAVRNSLSPKELQLCNKTPLLTPFNYNERLAWRFLPCQHVAVTRWKWKSTDKLGGEGRNKCCLYYWKFASTLILGDKFNFTGFRIQAGYFGKCPTWEILWRYRSIGSALVITVMLLPLCWSMALCSHHHSSCCKFNSVSMLIKDYF